MSWSWRRSRERGHRAAHRLAQLARAARRRVAAQLERLAAGEQHDRRDRLGELQDAAAVARGDRPHAHLVLVVRLGAAREGRRGHRELLRLGRERGRRDLHRLEAVIARAVRREVRGQAVARRGLHSSASGDRADRRCWPRRSSARPSRSHVPAVEVAAVQHVAGIGIDQRVVVRRC